MKKRNMILAAVAVAAVAIGIGFGASSIRAGAAGRCGFAMQQGGGHGPRGPHGPGGEDRLFDRLNLSDAQKQQIKALRDKQRTDAEQYHEQLRSTHEQMRALVEAAAFDETAVRALAAQEAQIATELHVVEARTGNAIFNTLTAEQKTKLAELHKTRGPGRE